MWGAALTIVAAVADKALGFLNARVDAKARIHLSDNDTLARVTSTVIDGASKADELNAAIRKADGKWSPLAITSIVGFLLPFAWHTWQVVLDSSRWHPVVNWMWGIIPMVGVREHVVGSWKVAALPGLFEGTEHAVIQSLFVGAATAAALVPVIKALKR